MSSSVIPERNWVNIQWLARLRWAEVGGQAVTVLVAQFLLGGSLPLVPLLAVIGVGLVSNIIVESYFFGDRHRGATTGWFRRAGASRSLGWPAVAQGHLRSGEAAKVSRMGRPRVGVCDDARVIAANESRGRSEERSVQTVLEHRSDEANEASPQMTCAIVAEWQLGLVMMLDIALLTGLLYLSGGPHNPFALLYLVQIALATVVVRALWTWMLVGLSFVGFGILLVAHRPLKIPDDSRMIGAWVALGVASAFVVHFLQRINGALSERERELTEARGLAARQERLAALATMAAGAAHELSTPLGTVALAAKELERVLTGDHAADARLIREQVGRCRAILEQMALGAGTVGESIAACTVAEFVDDALIGIRETPPVVRDMAREVALGTLRIPRRALGQALRSLVTNAQDASPATAAVVVAVWRTGEMIELAVRDRGSGIPEEVRARIGEPFFTTKPPGRGMGLGLFLARAVIEGVGGTMRIESEAGGTEVRARLPADVTGRMVSEPV